MIFKKLIVFILLSVALLATQHNADNLAKFSATSLFNLDSLSLKETLKVYLQNHPKIKALKVIEDGNVFITYYNKDNQQIFYKPIPKEYLNLIQYTADITYENKTIGTIKIFYENNFFSDLLTEPEKQWLKEHSTLKISNEYDWAPYDYQIDNEPKGYSIDYMNLLADKIGIKLQYVSAPWDTLLTQFKNKELDLMHVMSKDEQREKYTLFSDTYITMNLSLITGKNSSITSLKDLDNKKLALTKGWSSTKYIKKHYPNIKIIEKDHSQEILNEVAFGNADAAIEDEFIANYMINRNFLKNLKVISNVQVGDFNQNLHIGIRKDYPLLHTIIQKALRSLSEEEIITLNKKWIKPFNVQQPLFTKEERAFIQHNPTIIVGGETDWPPFDYVENNKYTGIAKEYLDLIEKHSGLKFDVKTGYTWNQLINMAKDKKIDLLPMLYFSKEREEYLNFTDSFLNIRHYFYAKENSEKYKNFEELNGKTIAILKGSAQIDIIKEKYPNIKILETKNSLEAIDKVIANEADGLIENTALVAYLLKSNNITGITGIFPTNLGVNKLHMATTKDLVILKDIIQKSLNAVTQEEHEQIAKKWIGVSSDKISIDLTAKEKHYLENKKELTLCVKPNLLPYEMIKKGSYIGIAADYINVISQKIDTPIKILPVKSNKDTFKLLKEKKCDIRPIMMVKQANKTSYKISTPYLKDSIVLITDIKEPFMKDIDAHMDKTYVVNNDQKGIVTYIKALYPNIKLKYSKSIEEAYKMVLNKEAFGLLDKSLTTTYKIQKDYSTTLKIMNELHKIQLGMGVVEDDKVLLGIINKVIKSIDEKTKIKIRNDWHSTTIESKIDYSLLWYVLAIILTVMGLFLYKQIILNKANKLLAKTNEDLQNQKKEFEAIFSSSKDGIAIVDLKSHFLNCNQAYIDMLGYSKEELLKKSCIEITLESDREKTIEAMRNVIKNGFITNFEKRCVDKNGNEIFVNMTSSLLPDENRILLITKDISSIKIIEEQSRLASMGEMIGNIAHQWRQPLNLISTGSTGILFHQEIGTLTDDIIKKEMNRINDSAQYLSQTIDDFRDFIKGDTKFSNVKIKEVVDSALSIVEASIKSHYITLQIDIDDSIEVYGSKNELEQAIINIVNNAKDILIDKNINDPHITLKTKIIDNNSFDLIICDNGGGISDDVLPKVFDPYFTTKHQSKGTGIGLSMVDKIIRERHKQTVTVHNEINEFNKKEYMGACFVITFKNKKID